MDKIKIFLNYRIFDSRVMSYAITIILTLIVIFNRESLDAIGIFAGIVTLCVIFLVAFVIDAFID